jgi:hypothetical protein
MWGRSAYRTSMEKPDGMSPQEDLDVGERITLKWILEKLDGVVCFGFIWLTVGTSGRLLWTR